MNISIYINIFIYDTYLTLVLIRVGRLLKISVEETPVPLLPKV